MSHYSHPRDRILRTWNPYDWNIQRHRVSYILNSETAMAKDTVGTFGGAATYNNWRWNVPNSYAEKLDSTYKGCIVSVQNFAIRTGGAGGQIDKATQLRLNTPTRNMFERSKSEYAADPGRWGDGCVLVQGFFGIAQVSGTWDFTCGGDPITQGVWVPQLPDTLEFSIYTYEGEPALKMNDTTNWHCNFVVQHLFEETRQDPIGGDDLLSREDRRIA